MMATLTHAPHRPTVSPLRRSIDIVRADLGAYLILNLLYYGLVVLGMAYVTFVDPGLQPALLPAVGQAFATDPLAALGEAYGSGQVLLAMLLTLLVNLLLGSAV